VVGLWTTDIEYLVLAKLRAIVGKKLKADYPNLNFTNEDTASTQPKFPTVYIKRLPGGETSQDLERTSINGIVSGFQIEVTTNTKQRDAQVVADECCLVMKSMSYEMIGEPVPDNTPQIKRVVARYRRNVDYNDIL